MRKILYIFLAHVIVLGSLWAWKNREGNDLLMVQDSYQADQPFYLLFSRTESSQLKLLVCIDNDSLEDILPGEKFHVAMTAHARPDAFDFKKVPDHHDHNCYNILLNASDSQCSIVCLEE